MKKLFSAFVLLMLAIVLVACGGDKPKDANAPDDSGDSDSKKEEVTLRIASWSFGTEGESNMDRLMIEEFEKNNPHIKVEIDESIDPADWNGSLSAAASGSSMPDLFLLAQIPTGLANDWLLDLNEYTEADTDFENIPETVVESVKHDGIVRALPAGQHFLGYFVNKDLFGQANMNAPTMGLSIEEFSAAIRDVTNVNEGVAGLNHPFTIADWYPASVNEDLGWYTYDEGFNLDSNEFIAGINFANNILANDYAYETLTDDQKANFNGENPEEVWLNGGVGIKWDGSWITGHLAAESDFEWDFIGIPGDRIVMTHDYYGVSSSTKHPKEAYELAKWMSFGSEGFLERMKIADEVDGVDLATLPVSTDQTVLDAYFEKMDVPGFEKAYENIDQAIVEPVKIVPGYVQSRWEAPTGIAIGEEPNANIAGLIDAAVRGEINIEDYAGQINKLANEKYQEGLEAINK